LRKTCLKKKKVVLGYWDIRGLANPIRLLLEYTHTPYEDKLYVVGPPPTFDRGQWFTDKEKFGSSGTLDFPNVPYYFDGDIKITQSNAILRHIARKNNLVGGSEKEKAYVDMLGDEALDYGAGLVRLAYNSDFEKLKGPFFADSVPAALKRFEGFLGDKKWMMGDNLTWPDFKLYELFDETRLMSPGILDKHPKIKAYLDRFEAIPEIAAYLKSNKAIKRFNNRMAKWGAEEIHKS